MSDPDLTPAELDEIERVAMEATPGPWKHGKWQYESTPKFRYTEIRPDNDEDISITRDTEPPDPGDSQTFWSSCVVSGCGCCGSPSGSKTDARHIARLDPPTALRLVRMARDRDEAIAHAKQSIEMLAAADAKCAEYIDQRDAIAETLRCVVEEIRAEAGKIDHEFDVPSYHANALRAIADRAEGKGK